MVCRYDFYLVSQSMRQDTVTPTSYNLVKDIFGLRPDHIQSLTCMLTHIFYNYPGTVGVPASCKYAEDLASLVANTLENFLYYLDY